jgi:FMN phosphatase YigB (HAD superfamily)
MSSSALQLRRESSSSVSILEYARERERHYSVSGEPAHGRPAPSAILFAYENVLYDATVWERWLWQLLRRVGATVDQQSFAQDWQYSTLREVYRGRREFDEAFRDRLRQWGLSPGLIDEVSLASQPRRRQLFAEARLLPQVRQTLFALAQEGLALGLLADSDLAASELEDNLTRLGFGGRFAFVLSSIELGFTKTDPEGYRAAATRFGRPMDQIAFVGTLAPHLSTAARLGMPTIAFNYDEQAWADLYVRQFDELIPLLHSWPLGA